MMTWPHTLMVAYLMLGIIGDTYEHKDNRSKPFWAGRIIGHVLNIAFVSYILHWGGFW